MKTRWVATLNARKFKAISHQLLNWKSVGFTGVLLLIVSCSKGDDVETVNNELPVKNESLIIYTDIEPDFASENMNDFYSLDLNNDATVDFTLTTSYDDRLEITSSNDVNGIVAVYNLDPDILPLEINTKILNAFFSTNGEYGSYMVGGFFEIGNCFGEVEDDCFYDWKDKNDKYLGLRFVVEGNTHYGWARLNVTNQTDWVIKDYAYNAIPYKPILAGQKE
ncbi:MAG: hypothetical protein ABIO60_06825 [Aquaticitalea sp.]